jgi:transcriptional regulator with XRE-family HTH domain
MSATATLAGPSALPHGAAPAGRMSIGDHLRAWRERRRLSQLALALEAGISTRHLSFLETGRSQPSREMVMLLATHLDIPLRERNVLLVAGGFAPVYSERPFDDPGLEAARRAIALIVQAHEPFPALAVNRHWEMVTANRAIPALLSGVAEHLLKPPINVLRLSLHPDGLAGRIVNLRQWREHLLERLRHQIAVTADPKLVMLLAELQRYPGVEGGGSPAPGDYGGLVIPMHLSVPGRVLKMMSTTTIFGSPMDVTVSELAIESFFPIDEPSAEFLRALASGGAA